MDGGSVLDLVKKKLLKEKHIAIIVREVLLGCALTLAMFACIAENAFVGDSLQYLNQEGKIHRDIKAANILLRREGFVKVCLFVISLSVLLNLAQQLGDFGASRQLNDTVAKCNTFVGSPYWCVLEPCYQP